MDREYAQLLVDRCEQSARMAEWGQLLWVSFLTIEDPIDFWWFYDIDSDLFPDLDKVLGVDKVLDGWRKITRETRALRPIVLPDATGLDLPGDTYEELYGSDQYIKTGTESCHTSPDGVYFTAGVHPLQTEIDSVWLSYEVLKAIADGELELAIPAKGKDSRL